MSKVMGVADQISDLVLGARELGIALDDSQVHLFEVYLREVLAWNKRRNIVSRKDETRIGAYHFLDSLSAHKLLPEDDGFRCLDVGPGAGFPGIPLKILRPDMALELAEPRRWRYLFLDKVIRVLALSNTILHRDRVEDLPPEQRSYDVILARAVASLKDIVPLALPRLSSGGTLIVYKSGDITAETDEALDVIEAEGARVDKTEIVTLPITGIRRALVVIEKT
jgi:16S rRNA (guanine527-N7)-methyltransferase